MLYHQRLFRSQWCDLLELLFYSSLPATYSSPIAPYLSFGQAGCHNSTCALLLFFAEHQEAMQEPKLSVLDMVSMLKFQKLGTELIN